MINIKNTWDYITEGMLNLIYPLNCENCGKPIRESKGYGICRDCLKKISYILPPLCYQCGKPFSSLVDFEKKALCSDCSYKKELLYYNRSIAYYEGAIRKSIHLLKYKKQLKLIKPLGELMVKYLLTDDFYNNKKIDLIIPVPLTEREYKKRNFNQSGLLADYIAKYFSIPFGENFLLKNVENLSQVGLTKNERAKNVKNVFSVNPLYKKNIKNILLIDDIYTTGATIESCSKELKKHGIVNVFALTLARGI
ncbi:MAG: ComF family protein [Candidatus Caldatribacteriota bacterium]|jgi:ComF family protein|nr:ComF family protein [Atribacterota bacterium]MDD3030927.1 ComF family protein [Atribacterota bacterium]MDD3640458.1 ComF family protein [Atribacterota bacterium]MDD4288602.1 ComF family protein [Atribacterota bacterium]MDD4765398.1 ComF family protein [Atribacterota bacterium]